MLYAHRVLLQALQFDELSLLVRVKKSEKKIKPGVPSDAAEGYCFFLFDENSSTHPKASFKRLLNFLHSINFISDC